MRIIDHLASFLLPLHLLYVANEMAIRVQPTITDIRLKTARGRKGFADAELGMTQRAARDSRTARSDASLGVRFGIPAEQAAQHENGREELLNHMSNKRVRNYRSGASV